MPITRQQLVNQLLPSLEKIFSTSYEQLNRTEYHLKRKYGKCTIYRWDYENGILTSTTLAKGLDNETAEGMMKLLKEPT
jgi:hypothetical protein